MAQRGHPPELRRTRTRGVTLPRAVGRVLDRMRGVRLRIAIVAGGLWRFDGISSGALHTIRAASSVPDWTVSVFTKRNEFTDVPAHVVHRARELSRHQAFRAADVVIYQFGFFSELFEIMPQGHDRARQIVFFHNITPEQFVVPGMREGIRLSFRQLAEFRHVDWLWPVSATNAGVLAKAGFDPGRIEVVPPAIEWPPPSRLGSKSAPPIRILFVGRITASKGVIDLVKAVGLIRAHCGTALEVSIVGKAGPDEQDYRTVVAVAIAERRLGDVIRMHGRTESDELAALYRGAHILAIPSYHEGFCRPVAEGLRAGCVPVGYAAYNLPLVANGLGRLVPAGDIEALAQALQVLVEGIASGATLPLDGGPLTIAEFDAAAAAHVAQFSFGNFARTVTSRIRALTSKNVTGEERTGRDYLDQ